MAFAMSITAFAAEDAGTTTGKITIDNAVAGQTYEIYKIFDLESFSADQTSYAYKVNDAWEDFFKTGAGKDFVTVDDAQKYVTLKKDVTNDAVAKLAKDALAYAKEKNIAADKVAVAELTQVTFEKLPLGYYLVDSSLGTLCSLNTTSTEVIIKEKNIKPTDEKQVYENSDDTWGKANDASVGDTVNFKATIYAKKGAVNYVFHDKMDKGLTFNGSVTVKVGNQTLAANQQYVLRTENLSDDCTFEVEFVQEYLDTITEETDIVIEYSAVLNKDAVVAGDGNLNKEYLTYGDKNTETEGSQTVTKTWIFSVEKYDAANAEKKLAGAEFVLKKDDKEINFVKDETTNTYKVAEKGAQNTTTKLVTNDNGGFTVAGLDSGKYELVETKAPAGYNQLKDPVTVTIDKEGIVEKTTNNVVKVENKTGSILPSTGGMGTTIFYVLGAILTLGAAVVLIVRRRMRVQ